MTSELPGAAGVAPQVSRGVPVLCAPAVLVLGVWLASSSAHWVLHGFSWTVVVFSLFFAITLLIYVSTMVRLVFEARIEAEYRRSVESGEDAGAQLGRVLRAREGHGGFDPRYWVRAWALHAREERGFLERRSYLFVVETSNCLINTVPIVFILVMMTWQAVPAPVLGMIIALVCYQLLHGTVTHFIAALLLRGDRTAEGAGSRVFDFGANMPWLLFPAAGIVAGVCLVVSGGYDSVLR